MPVGLPAPMEGAVWGDYMGPIPGPPHAGPTGGQASPAGPTSSSAWAECQPQTWCADVSMQSDAAEMPRALPGTEEGIGEYQLAPRFP